MEYPNIRYKLSHPGYWLVFARGNQIGSVEWLGPVFGWCFAALDSDFVSQKPARTRIDAIAQWPGI